MILYRDIYKVAENCLVGNQGHECIGTYKSVEYLPDDTGRCIVVR